MLGCNFGRVLPAQSPEILLHHLLDRAPSLDINQKLLLMSQLVGRPSALNLLLQVLPLVLPVLENPIDELAQLLLSPLAHIISKSLPLCPCGRQGHSRIYSLLLQRVV